MANIKEFLKYFESKYDEINEVSRLLCNKKNNEQLIKELFNISHELLNFIKDDKNLINPHGNVILVDEFKNYLINCLSRFDSLYIHSPLGFSREQENNSFYYTAPEIIRESYFQLITVYIWCKHFTDQGYSGVLPEMIFD